MIYDEDPLGREGSMNRTKLYERFVRHRPLTPQQLAELFIDDRRLTAADIQAGQRVYREIQADTP